MKKVENFTVLRSTKTLSIAFELRELMSNFGFTQELRSVAKNEFRTAYIHLSEVFSKSMLESLQVTFPPCIPGESLESMTEKFELMMQNFIQKRKEKVKPERYEKLKSIGKKWFKLSYPFAQQVLSVVKEGSSVLQRFDGFSHYE